ncbi:ABC transporter transmembrane domain-containing protein, partial [Escherichia coli]
FIPAIIKYRKIFFEVLVVSFFLQFFLLVSPLFFQVIMDKVLVHRGFSTLNVITIALTLVIVFEVILTGVRSYIFAHTTSRIDVELGSKLFRHLLSLPISYFENRRAGDTVARIRELEKVRDFLTGQALTTVLDLFFSFVLLSVMWYYSPKLTLVVILSLPCYVIWSMIISPILRNRLDDKFVRNADNHSFLVESVTAINTIKAMALSPQMTNNWDKQLAAYVYSSFRVTVLATIGQQGIQLIQKVVMVINLWLGAHFVISGDLSIGQLIAFNMLASQVIAPVIRLAQLWQDFQQIGISISRLGDVLNLPTETYNGKLSLPEIKGNITFRNVCFRYKPEAPLTLNNINLLIKQGEIIGIVGRSGSGKSTLTKLIQRFYLPE